MVDTDYEHIKWLASYNYWHHDDWSVMQMLNAFYNDFTYKAYTFMEEIIPTTEFYAKTNANVLIDTPLYLNLLIDPLELELENSNDDSYTTIEWEYRWNNEL